MIHEDHRRTLEDFPEAKLIIAKQDCVLGDHYHKIKTEHFLLINGDATILIGDQLHIMESGRMYTVSPGIIHRLTLWGGGTSVIGLCSHPYDPTDDYK